MIRYIKILPFAPTSPTLMSIHSQKRCLPAPQPGLVPPAVTQWLIPHQYSPTFLVHTLATHALQIHVAAIQHPPPVQPLGSSAIYTMHHRPSPLPTTFPILHNSGTSPCLLTIPLYPFGPLCQQLFIECAGTVLTVMRYQCFLHVTRNPFVAASQRYAGSFRDLLYI